MLVFKEKTGLSKNSVLEDLCEYNGGCWEDIFREIQYAREIPGHSLELPPLWKPYLAELSQIAAMEEGCNRFEALCSFLEQENVFNSLLNSCTEDNSIGLWGVELVFDNSLRKLCQVSYDDLYNHYLYFLEMIRSGTLNAEFENKCLYALFDNYDSGYDDECAYKRSQLSEVYFLPNGWFMFVIDSIWVDDSTYGETWFFDNELSYVGSIDCYGVDAFSAFIKSDQYRKYEFDALLTKIENDEIQIDEVSAKERLQLITYYKERLVKLKKIISSTELKIKTAESIIQKLQSYDIE